MRINKKTWLSASTILFCGFINGGCATIRTVESAKPDIPPVYSGTRLNICSMTGDDKCQQRFGVEPSGYPLFDLPGSIILDTLIFPATVVRAFIN
ncbi:MAG TPA: YceK/YidQ family lipoprotein [Chromatiales bacterium]|nr:YceK/YidQ family lipoprotein [Thiotrichales bacterium]HIP69226.1 YceK/YidQ family lipoprotein [Chromatiales bacterium]